MGEHNDDTFSAPPYTTTKVLELCPALEYNKDEWQQWLIFKPIGGYCPLPPYHCYFSILSHVLVCYNHPALIVPTTHPRLDNHNNFNSCLSDYSLVSLSHSLLAKSETPPSGDSLTSQSALNCRCEYLSVALGEENIRIPLDALNGSQLAVLRSLTKIALSPVYRTSTKVTIIGTITLGTRVSPINIKRYESILLKFALCAGAELSINYISENSCQAELEQHTISGITDAFFTARISGRCTHKVQITPDLKEQGSSLLLLTFNRALCPGGSLLEFLFSHKFTRFSVPSTHSIRLFLEAINECATNSHILSCLNIGPGGIAITLTKMAIMGNRGVNCQIPRHIHPNAFLFSETPGIIAEVHAHHEPEVMNSFTKRGFHTFKLGKVCSSGDLARIIFSQVEPHVEKLVLDECVTLVKNQWMRHMLYHRNC